MLVDSIKYLLGSAGPSGFGSTSTADDVTAAAEHHLAAVTAIITGIFAACFLHRLIDYGW